MVGRLGEMCCDLAHGEFIPVWQSTGSLPRRQHLAAASLVLCGSERRGLSGWWRSMVLVGKRGGEVRDQNLPSLTTQKISELAPLHAILESCFSQCKCILTYHCYFQHWCLLFGYPAYSHIYSHSQKINWKEYLQSCGPLLFNLQETLINQWHHQGQQIVNHDSV